jgi:hypothetical protein
MKRLTWLLSVLAVAAVVGAIAQSPVQAACALGYQVGSLFPFATYVYADCGPECAAASINTLAGAGRLGRLWEPGKRNGTPGVQNTLGQDEGGCDATLTCGGASGGGQWWHRFSTFPWYINAQLDQPPVDGCPGVTTEGDTPSGPDEVIVALLDLATDNSNAYYYAARVGYFPANTPEFNMAQGTCSWPHFHMLPIPRPVVTGSTRVDSNTVNLSFSLADVAPAFHGESGTCVGFSAYNTITGYRICQAETSTGDPGRLASAYTCAAGPATALGGATVTNLPIDCTDTTPPIDNDRYVAIQLAFDGGAVTPYFSEYVSKAVRVECDPALAQPEIQQRRPRGVTQEQPRGKGPR